MNEETIIGLMKRSLNENVVLSEIKPDRMIPKRKSWLARHVNAVSGLVCIVAAIALFIGWIGRMRQPSLSFYETSVRLAVLVIALYCLMKGVFTLAFHLKERKFDVSVHQFLIGETYNRIYFVYERMVWLWVLLPALLVVVPALFGIATNYGSYYWLVAAVVFIIMVLAFSPLLVRQLKRLKQEIKSLKQSNN